MPIFTTFRAIWPPLIPTLAKLCNVQNSLKSPERLYAWLSLKCVPKFSFKFQLRESLKNNISSTFAWTTLNNEQNSSEHHESYCAILSTKSVDKSMIKFLFWEIGQTFKLCCAIFLRLGLKGVKIFWNVAKFCMHACLSNGHPNLWSNFNSNKLRKSETS